MAEASLCLSCTGRLLSKNTTAEALVGGRQRAPWACGSPRPPVPREAGPRGQGLWGHKVEAGLSVRAGCKEAPGHWPQPSLGLTASPGLEGGREAET